MIGLFATEDYTALEFRPIAASFKMRWATIQVKLVLPERMWGEWGFAFGKHDIWLYSQNECRFVDYKRILPW